MRRERHKRYHGPTEAQYTCKAAALTTEPALIGAKATLTAAKSDDCPRDDDGTCGVNGVGYVATENVEGVAEDRNYDRNDNDPPAPRGSGGEGVWACRCSLRVSEVSSLDWVAIDEKPKDWRGDQPTERIGRHSKWLEMIRVVLPRYRNEVLEQIAYYHPAAALRHEKEC